MSGKKKQADNEYSPNWGGSRDNSDQNTVMQKLGELIDNGDYRAIEMFMKYVHGTPKQTVDLNSSSSVDLNVTLKGLISFDE